jgi:mannitol-1-phosphate/altronate dehydrogenase
VCPARISTSGVLYFFRSSVVTRRIDMDDSILVLERQAEFRAGYASWRKGASRGAVGEVGKGNSVGDAAGNSALRKGNKNWRTGGAAGMKHSSAGAVGLNARPMSRGMAVEAASRGENWLRFFLHPESDFHRNNSGGLECFTLSAANLPAIACTQKQALVATQTRLPAYERRLESFHGVICHIGVGGFYRSHQAVYTQKLLLEPVTGGDGKRWCFVGIGLMPWDKGMKDVMEAQNCLYTVTGRSPEATEGMVVGSMVDFVYAPEDDTGTTVVERLASPTTKIVSLTITEKGYCLNVDGQLDLGNALIKHDLEHPGERPHSAVGLIVKALRVRRQRGVTPFTVLSCDNLPGNGSLSRTMVLDFLDALCGSSERGASASNSAPIGENEKLRAWISSRVKFPNTMVDRITPATRPVQARDDFSDGIRKLVKENYGIEDQWPVIAELYSQWVIEDNFVGGARPQWDLIAGGKGALMVNDVHAYEMMKLRLLNAGHSALSYASYLAGKSAAVVFVLPIWLRMCLRLPVRAAELALLTPLSLRVRNCLLRSSRSPLRRRCDG